MPRITQYLKFSHALAGFIAVLVGYSSTVAIVFQSANSAGATTAELTSWMWALGIGLGITCIGLSWAYKQPVLTAWSTPGAALLVTSLSGLSMNQAIGAFLFSSALITLSGLTGWFHRIMEFMPRSIASAMLAGILVRFGMDIFTSMESEWGMVFLMFITFLLARLWLPRYAVPLALGIGIVWAAFSDTLHLGTLDWTPAKPVFMMPDFTLSSLIGVGLPLFIVTMTSQNVPGLAALRAHGYQVPASPLISWTGITGLILGPFGGYAYNLAAITAAICMSKDVDHNPSRRYLAAMWAGGFYLATGLFGATVVGIFTAFPRELVAAIAGLALLGTIGNSLAQALDDPGEREAALVTFLTSASGMSLAGIGGAFWGLVFGMLIYVMLRFKRKMR